MKKRIILTALSAVLVAGLFIAPTGCKKEEKDTGGGVKREVVDLEGYEFTWATMWEWINYPESGASDYGDKRLDRYKEVEDQFNCKIKKIDLNADSFFDSVNAAIMAGDKFADFIEVDFMRYQVLMNNKALMPLNQIEGFDASQSKFSDSFRKAYTADDGNVYGLQYQVPNFVTGGTGTMIFFNKTLFKKYNQPDLYTLIDEGQWNFDKFGEIAKALTKDTNGDNEIDQWGMGTIDWHHNSLEKPMIFANGSSIIKRRAADNKWEFALLESKAQTALNFLAKLELQDKVLSPASTTGSPSDAVDHFTNGNVGMFFTSPEMIERINKNMDDEWGLVPLPKGPDATDYVQSEVSLRSFVMLKNNQADSKKAAIVFDAISDTLTADVTSDEALYFDQYVNNMLNGDEKALEMIKLCITKMTPDYSWGATAATNQLGTVFDACLRKGSMTVKSAMEMVAPVFQGFLEGFFYPVEPDDTTSSQ